MMKDDSDARDQKFRFMTTGDGTTVLPLLFDELYVTHTKESASGLTYSLITKHTGQYVARTRIGAEKFETYEEPDIKALLTKAGFSAKDKPLIGKE
jgi:hypothetical protein